MTVRVRVEEIEANGLSFRVRRAGEEDAAGDGVILLHGFPETSHMWIPLMKPLAERGYRCLAPDQRGYSPGARPPNVADYRYAHLVDDVIALADAAGFERFHLVGHDHGAGVGWTVAYLHPERLLSWTAHSVPHVEAFRDAILHDPDQRERSKYIARFEQEGRAEEAFLANLDDRWSERHPEQAADYRAVFSQPGAITGAFNWYRASLRYDGSGEAPTVGTIQVPTLLIWGNLDGAIGRASNEATADLVDAPYRFVELDAGHWLIQDETEVVVRETVAHIKAHSASAAT